VSPELVLVDPDLAECERLRLNREAVLDKVFLRALLDEVEVLVQRALDEVADYTADVRGR
jgi:hypothetical protein